MAAGEDIQHLFIHCDFANTLWSRLEDVFQVSLDKTSDLKSLFKLCFKKANEQTDLQLMGHWCALYYIAKFGG